MKKGFLAILLSMGMLCGLSSCGAQKEENAATGSDITVESDAAVNGEGGSDGYREYVMSWWGEPFALSVKVPECYLNENSEKDLSHMLDENLDREKVKENTFMPIPTLGADITLYNGAQELELDFDNLYGEEAQIFRAFISGGEFKDRLVRDIQESYTCEPAGQKEENGMIKQFFRCKNADEELKRVSALADMDDDLIMLCSITSRGEGAELEDLEEIMDSLIFTFEPDKRVYGILDDGVNYDSDMQVEAAGTEEGLTDEADREEEPAASEESSGNETANSAKETEEAAEPSPEPVPIFAPLDYSDDDWRCAGFYLNGEFAKLPMSWEEFSALGFASLCRQTIGSFQSVEQCMVEEYPIRPYYYLINSLYAYNDAEEMISVYFVNTEGEEQDVKDCIVYKVRFVGPSHENFGGYGELPEDVKLCNGISWDTTYEEVIALMGEADKVIDVSEDKGFCGTLTYYMEEGNRKRRVEFEFYNNIVDTFSINALPIDGKW